MANEEFGLGFTTEQVALFNDFAEGSISPAASLFSDLVDTDEIAPAGTIFADLPSTDEVAPGASLFVDLPALDKIGPVVTESASGICYIPSKLSSTTLYSQLSINPSGSQNVVSCHEYDLNVSPTIIEDLAPLVWFDAADENTIGFDSEPNVSSWRSKGSIPMVVTQSTPAFMPQRVPGTGLFFDGSDDFLRQWPSPGISDPFGEIWAVSWRPSGAAAAPVWTYSEIGDADDFFSHYSSKNIYLRIGGTLSYSGGDGGVPNNNWVISRIFLPPGSTLSVWQAQTYRADTDTLTDGITSVFGTTKNWWFDNHGQVDGTAFVIAGRHQNTSIVQWTNIYVADILIFNKRLSETDADNLRDHFKKKWGMI